jgi:hypothetical protein
LTVSVLAVFVDTVNHTDKVVGFQWTLKAPLKQKNRELTGSIAGFWTSLDVLLLVLGGERGIVGRKPHFPCEPLGCWVSAG